MNKQNKIIFTLILLSIAMTVVEVILNARGEGLSDTTQILWGGIFIIMSTLWVVVDADSNNFEKPFDFDFLIYIFWPIALPYYLISTRGLEGAIIFFGFINLWLGPWLAGLVAYTYVYNPQA